MSDTSLFTRDDLQHQRERVRRSFLQANSAVAVVLVAVLGLVLAAVLASARASHSQERAEAAERDAREKLWRAYLAQAQATRLTGRQGRRQQSLRMIGNATAILPSVALRNEAIAALTSFDLEIEGKIHPVELPFRQCFQFGLQRYAIAASDGEVVVCRTRDHAAEMRLTREEAGIPKNTLLGTLEFSRDGRFLVVGFRNGAVAVWNLAERKPSFVRQGMPGHRMNTIELGDDGRICLAERIENETRILLIDPASGAVRTLPIDLDIRGASARPGTNQFGLSLGEEVQMWTVDKPRKISSYPTPGAASAPTWSSDGMRFAVATTDGGVFLWDLRRGECQPLIGHTESVRLMVFSPDDTVLMTTGWDNTTRLWDVQSGRPILVSEGDLGSEFSQDGRRIGFARPGHGVGIWRFETNPILQVLQPRLGANDILQHCDLSASGRWLAAVVGGDLQLWDLSRPGATHLEPLHDVSTVTFHPDERSLLLCRGNGVELRSIMTNSAGGLAGLGPPEQAALPPGLQARQATLSLDGRALLVEAQDLRLFAMDLLAKRPPVLLQAHQHWLNKLTPGSGTGSGRTAISPDGRWVAVGYSVGPGDASRISAASQRAGVWDAQSGKLVFTPEEFGGVTFSPDNRWLVLRSEKGCSLYKLGTWSREQFMPLDNLATQIGASAMPMYGRLLATSRSRQSVELLDPEDGSEIATLTSPVLHSVTRLRCALDGSKLAVGTADHQILLWDLKGLRRELEALGLDWGAAAPITTAKSARITGTIRRIPKEVAVIGLTSAGVTLIGGFLVLRWHRRLIQRFVRTEATVEKRGSQLEIAKLELLQAEKMKALGTLAAGIAHDFNNLLSVIRMSNRLIPRARSAAEVTEYVNAVEQAVLQGKTVVASMLGYSRESGPDEKPGLVGPLIEQTALLLSREFLSGITLKLELAPNTPPVRLNQGRLQQALLNLVVNAAEAMKGSGTLVISAGAVDVLPEMPGGRYALRPQPAPGYVQVAVADSGPGIPPDIADRIFEPFFTTKTAGTQKGTGLGLSLVHTLASQEGLGLALRPAPGGGAIFFLFLPIERSSDFPKPDVRF